MFTTAPCTVCRAWVPGVPLGISSGDIYCDKCAPVGTGCLPNKDFGTNALNDCTVPLGNTGLGGKVLKLSRRKQMIRRQPGVHYIRIKEPYFSAIKNDLQTAIVEKDDKDCHVGDLMQFDFDDQLETGFSLMPLGWQPPSVKAQITSILENTPGLVVEYVMISFRKL